MEGKETELDKTIIEAIKDPLTHIVRNSVDHGIEAPEVRLAKGKPAEGCLSLRAFHEGGQVNIEITDDGAGINAEKVKSKAVERGLITREQAARLSEREIINLLFMPGFSTAEKITNVSGRGVGMDVVKTNIEKIGGMVDIQNRPDQGTTLKIKIPLTLAIIPALIVTTAGDRYAIPQVSLLELVRLEGKQAQTGIEMIHGAPVYRLRGNLLPLLSLRQELAVDTEEKTSTRSPAMGRGRKTGRAHLDFEGARSKHRLWKGRLQDFLDGKSTLSQAEAVSHTDCALGKWLYGEALKEFGNISQLKQLEQVHKDVHTLIKQIVLHKSAGEQSQAEALFHQVGPLSDQIIALLDQIETVVKADDIVNIVVLQADGRQFGLVVDGINDTEEIVVKPLGKHFKGIPLFAGATIMGDGRVALILDVLGIAHAPGWSRKCASVPWPKRRPGPSTRKPSRRRSSFSAWARTAAWPSRCLWWHGWKKFLGPRSRRPTARRSSSIAARSCLCCVSRMSLGSARRPTRIRCRWLSTPRRGAVSAWWWDASWTLWRRRSTCAAMPAERVCSARWSFNSA